MVRTPFSVLKRSAGSDWMFHSRTSLGSARKLENEKFLVTGILNSTTGLYHSSLTRPLRYEAPKGPA